MIELGIVVCAEIIEFRSFSTKTCLKNVHNNMLLIILWPSISCHDLRQTRRYTDTIPDQTRAFAKRGLPSYRCYRIPERSYFLGSRSELHRDLADVQSPVVWCSGFSFFVCLQKENENKKYLANKIKNLSSRVIFSAIIYGLNSVAEKDPSL